MIGKLQAFALDCPDPAALAAFYAELVGGRVVDDGSEWVELEGTVLAFQRVADYRPPSWPGQEQPQQAHLDIHVGDLDTGQAQVLALGATLLEDFGGSKGWRVFADPAGHPFCLCRA
ncbi:VOC family protein [Streptacidiphilus sp. P02-A3a]|uniref:VOC family protein n=1 Tax=Streptacidiphilus sp. P02-A3a TaxID=2704468 RepID=UPI0015FC5E5C|nr:VOC family protein [Streptacidiphilus sp. P02-A3a]QMU68151.1 VOC family protein [Streptacidiphilus sp. P02-A3a]